MVQCPFVAVRCFADYFLFYLDADFVNIAYYLFLDLAFDYILDYLTLFDLDVLLIDYILYYLDLLGSLGAWCWWPKLFPGLPLQVPLADGGR